MSRRLSRSVSSHGSAWRHGAAYGLRDTEPPETTGLLLWSCSRRGGARQAKPGVQCGGRGCLCRTPQYHIVFRSLIFVADIVRELQREGIATDVEVHIPETYRYYGENTAEDTIEAALACGGSTWDTPGMVRPREGPRDKVSLAGDHLLQLISKTADSIKVCWPEGATRADADLVARAFMDTSENPARGAAVVCPAGLTFGSAASAGLEPVTVHSAPWRPG